MFKYKSTDKKICRKCGIFQQDPARTQTPLDDLHLLDTPEKHPGVFKYNSGTLFSMYRLTEKPQRCQRHRTSL